MTATSAITLSARTRALLVSSLLLACSSDEKERTPDTPDLPPVIDSTGGDVFEGNNPEPGDRPDNASFDPDQACAGIEAGTELAPATLLLLIDTSLSMETQAPGSNQSKWVITRRALLDAVADMPGTSSLGLVFYPDVGVGAMPCFDSETDVEIAALGGDSSAQRRRITTALMQQSPDGSTPTHDAYRYALEQLEAAEVQGPRYVTLITDGTPTYALGCEGSGLQTDPADPTPLIPEAASALARDIKTFVVGSPGSEDARESLSRMAEAGGTAKAGCSHSGPNYCHFDMTQEEDFARALSDTLRAITGIALSCSYDVPAPPNGSALDPSKVNVLFTPRGGEPEFLPRNDAPGCDEGWQFSRNREQVVLCRETCQRIEGASGEVALQFGCEGRVIF